MHFCACFLGRNGKRERRFFQTKALAETEAEVLKGQRQASGDAWMAMTNAERLEVISFLNDLRIHGVSLGHLGVLAGIVCAFDEDKAWFAELAGVGELAVSWRDAIGIFKAVFVGKQAKVNIAPLGPKPMALGACMFALAENSVRVLYPMPEKYAMKTTSDCWHSWRYTIPLGSSLRNGSVRGIAS